MLRGSTSVSSGEALHLVEERDSQSSSVVGALYVCCFSFRGRVPFRCGSVFWEARRVGSSYWGTDSRSRAYFL